MRHVWENKFIRITGRGANEIECLMDEAGRDGWEPYAVNEVYATLKRVAERRIPPRLYPGDVSR